MSGQRIERSIPFLDESGKVPTSYLPDVVGEAEGHAALALVYRDEAHDLAQTETFLGYVSDAEAARDTAQGHASEAESHTALALVYRDEAQAASTSAGESATAAASNESGASESASTAQAASQDANASASASQDAQVAAEAAQSGAESAQGEAELSATSAAASASDAQSAESASQSSATAAGEAQSAAEGHESQTLVYRDEAAQSAASAESHADRAEEARDETLSNAIEVGTSAGTRVSIGGEVVYYDSGWRDVSDYLGGQSSMTVEGSLQVRRTLNEIQYLIDIDSVTGSSGWFRLISPLPTGFNHDGSPHQRAFVGSGYEFHSVGGTTNGINWYGSVDPSGDGIWSTSLPTSSFYGQFTLTTSDPIPTSLPGTPA